MIKERLSVCICAPGVSPNSSLLFYLLFLFQCGVFVSDLDSSLISLSAPYSSAKPPPFC
ncbi:unnamed protein product [Amoebophrya sp. A25]|nr:unnamed protein product [Amoebophrya sp. A25]|eukprot:GSA25T00010798001.1